MCHDTIIKLILTVLFSLEKQQQTLPGDILLVTSFISYVGCFTRRYRIDLFNSYWTPYIGKVKVHIYRISFMDIFFLFLKSKIMFLRMSVFCDILYSTCEANLIRFGMRTYFMIFFLLFDNSKFWGSSY